MVNQTDKIRLGLIIPSHFRLPCKLPHNALFLMKQAQTSEALNKQFRDGFLFFARIRANAPQLRVVWDVTLLHHSGLFDLNGEI